MARTWETTDNVVPISDTDIEGIANLANYSIISGCSQSYSALNMDVTVAAGRAIVNGAPVTVAGGSVTLVADGSNPRWSWITVDSSGTLAVVSGTPAATPTVPEIGDTVYIALFLIPAGQTIANDITTKLDRRVMYPSLITSNYKSSTQVLTTTTSYADVTGAIGSTFAFDAAVNGVYLAEYWIPLVFGGTGGAKFQFTGPAAATNVDITGVFGGTSAEVTAGAALSRAITPVTAFSSDINALNSTTMASSNTAYLTAGSFVQLFLKVANGANAGAVTLQAAQNSSNSTTTLGIGSSMTVRRIA